ncbi:MAG: dihydroxy-acid dehydratase [Bdellovibrionales bacterium]
MVAINAVVEEVTNAIMERSATSRPLYEQQVRIAQKKLSLVMNAAAGQLPSGRAHADAGLQEDGGLGSKNIGIVTAYNDVLSAHRPYERYPHLIKEAARKLDASAQVAAGVPAMCDGVTQGQPAMDLSLLSRDVIALGAAVGLSHDVFDSAINLAICDKVVPGLLQTTADFGHLPTLYMGAGPMGTGQSNADKNKIRQFISVARAKKEFEYDGQTYKHSDDPFFFEAFLKELADKNEKCSYHGAGTCTFYGTANTNQMLLEGFGMQLPGTSFIPTQEVPMRKALIKHGTQKLVKGEIPAAADILTAKNFVNGIVTLVATGGSTNETLHLPAMAAAAGLKVTWEDIDKLSSAVPLITEIYPNGKADVNVFHEAGGTPLVLRNLLEGGFLHKDVNTVAGYGMDKMLQKPELRGEDEIVFVEGPKKPAKVIKLGLEFGENDVIRTTRDPVAPSGGLITMNSDKLGQGIAKPSAVPNEFWDVEYPVRIFYSQDEFKAAWEDGKITESCAVVIAGQSPSDNGMPETHKTNETLNAAARMGINCLIVTNGRFSGATGGTPAMIHLSKEDEDGPNAGIERLRDGDTIRLNLHDGSADVTNVTTEEFLGRERYKPNLIRGQYGVGRGMFNVLRKNFSASNAGAGVITQGLLHQSEDLEELAAFKKAMDEDEAKLDALIAEKEKVRPFEDAAYKQVQKLAIDIARIPEPA